MSKDPLEELFGPLSDDTQQVPAPAPARSEPARPEPSERPARVRAERVRTKPLSAGVEPAAAVAARGPRRPAMLPWIIVGLVAVLALIASILVVNSARTDPQQDQASESTQQTPRTTTPETDAADDTAAEDDEAEEDEEAEAAEKKDEAPEVDPGPTNELKIGTWNATSQLSQKFGFTSYTIPDNVNLVLSSPLIEQLPCEGQWGATKNDDGTYSVLKPAERCEAAPELYDQLWGLTDAFVKSIKAAG